MWILFKFQILRNREFHNFTSLKDNKENFSKLHQNLLKKLHKPQRIV